MSPAIIEIGIVEMDLTTLKVNRERSHFVRPEKFEISSRCTRLTGITTDHIRAGKRFPEVLASVVKEFTPSEALCCTWGNDADLIARECERHGLRTPLRNLLDLAHLVRGLLLLRDTPSLDWAVAALDLTFAGVRHTAVGDARNTALVHAAVLRRIGQHPDSPAGLHVGPAEAAELSPFAQKLLQAITNH
jgi:DNA polymerase III epsilon subunit-like protein